MCIDALRSAPARGFTLVELVVVIVVLSAGLVGILAVYNQAVAKSADPMLQQQALALAEGYLEEIIGMRCPGASPGGSVRGEWAFAADYDGVDDQPPVDVSGAALAGLEDYRVRVTVTADTLAGVPGCRVTVLATGDGGAYSTLTGFRAED